MWDVQLLKFCQPNRCVILSCFSLSKSEVWHLFMCLKTIFPLLNYLDPLPTFLLVCKSFSLLIFGCSLYIREINPLSIILAAFFFSWQTFFYTLRLYLIHNLVFCFSVLTLLSPEFLFFKCSMFLPLRRKCRGRPCNVEDVTLTYLPLMFR